MRKVLTVLLLSTLAIGTASAETLHFGTTTANPPFVTANGKNQPVGFDIDLAHALCQQMQAQCQFTAQRFDTLIPALRFKKFDAVIAGMEVISMREKQVAFSRPYRQALSGVVIVNKDVAHTFADLKAKKVGVVKGTLHQRYLRDKQKAVQAVPYDDVAQRPGRAESRANNRRHGRLRHPPTPGSRRTLTTPSWMNGPPTRLITVSSMRLRCAKTIRSC
ncbi:ArtI [Klebsiella pneumoniae]|nr:ArtI [Klebsiella pneumoniae]